jgi:aspartate beta-hydroxylase
MMAGRVLQSGTDSIARAVKRELSWGYVKASAMRRGVSVDSLQRVHQYIRNKFDPLRPGNPTDPLQRPGAYFPGLDSKPIHECSDFPWVAYLEARSDAIKLEFDALRDRGAFRPHPQKLADRGQWGAYFFFADGVAFESNCRECPHTAEALRRLPGATLAGRAFFSVVAPDTHLKAHCGATNTRLRCHLGLSIPSDSFMRVGTERVRWTEGRCLVFDDSYDHEVRNPSTERAVLLFDIWHPGLSEAERWAIQKLSQLSGRYRLYRRGIEENQ